ncbi:hypothetical protein MPTK1_2g17605 [Marchantia polymorpha subsp. ruderalis]
MLLTDTLLTQSLRELRIRISLFRVNSSTEDAAQPLPMQAQIHHHPSSAAGRAPSLLASTLCDTRLEEHWSFTTISLQENEGSDDLLKELTFNSIDHEREYNCDIGWRWGGRHWGSSRVSTDNRKASGPKDAVSHCTANASSRDPTHNAI